LDNVTHSLAGMLLAEAALVLRRESRPQVRAVAYLASALANNLPDSDIVYTWITGPKPLGSLLHHRGHTHTLLVALPMAWLLGLALWRWYSARNADASKRDQNLILGLCLVGPLLHLTMDFANNYGVHPFWPLSGRWFYGDTIFIVEPLWWAIAIPILAQLVRRGWQFVGSCRSCCPRRAWRCWRSPAWPSSWGAALVSGSASGQRWSRALP
jgi:inner membrane protein